MENLIIKKEEIYTPQDEVKSQIKGVYIIKDENGNVILSGHNMIVKTGRNYIFQRCFGNQDSKEFYIFFAYNQQNPIVTPDTEFPASNILPEDSFTNVDGEGEVFKLTVTPSQPDEKTTGNYAYLNTNTLSLNIKRTLVLNTEKATVPLVFNSFGLYSKDKDDETDETITLFSQANCNPVTINQRRKLIVYYSIRF